MVTGAGDRQRSFDNLGVQVACSTLGPRPGTGLVLEVPDGIDDEQKMEYGFGVMKANSEIEDRRDRMESGPRSLMAREAAIIAAWRARQ